MSFVKKGNLKALSTIYLVYYDLMYNYGLKYTCDTNTVEDSIQNVFIYLIKVRRNLGVIQNLTGYLLITFRRQLISDLRKKNKLEPIETWPENNFNYFDRSVENFENHADSDQIHSVVRQCIKSLPSKQQEIIYLRFKYELSYEEISVILGINIDSCYKTVYRSIKSMRSRIENLLHKKQFKSIEAYLKYRHN